MRKKKTTTFLAPSPIAVMLAENHRAFRNSVKLEIERDGDIVVIGEAKDGCEAVRLAMTLKPDVIIMDIGMPFLNGLQATRQILEAAPATRVIILSAYPDAEYINEALKCGASGYLIKQSMPEFLAQAVRKVNSGRTYFSESIPKVLRNHCLKVFSKSQSLKRRAVLLALSSEDSPHHGAINEKHGHFRN
jgi:DNA-binding NarL/FixJ family response regulator